MKGKRMTYYCMMEECKWEETTHKICDGIKCPKCSGPVMVRPAKKEVRRESMQLTSLSLINTFKGARNQGSPFVFVAIEAEGTKEVITIPYVSFNAKEKFYLNAYSDELVHVMNSKVKIVGLTHGNETALLDVL